MQMLSCFITFLLWSPVLGQAMDVYYSNEALSPQGILDTLYNITVNDTQHFRIQFHHNHSENSVLNLMTRYIGENGKDLDDFPVQIVVRQQLIVQSWNMPLELNHQSKFYEVSRMLCSTGLMVNTNLPVTVEASTFSQDDIKLQIQAHLFLNFTISMGTHYNIHVTPTSPQYYQYKFDESKDVRYVTLHVRSTSESCATVYIQQARCPVEDIGEIPSIQGVVVQTFLSSSTVVISKKRERSSVFIMFTVSPYGQPCLRSDQIGNERMKPLEFWIEPGVKGAVYTWGVLAAIFYCLVFYVVALIHWIEASSCGERKENPPVELTDLLPEEDEDAEMNAPMRTTRTAVYETIAGEPTDVDESTAVEETRVTNHPQDFLVVSDMTRKSYTKLQKKYMLYLWTTIIVSIFYAIPVIQLFKGYQRYLNLSGNEDTCYYNFQCARQLGELHSFNNVLSNLGYVLLGILFLIITGCRHCSSWKLSADERDNYGIPQHFGVFYAMGSALIIEGVMSGCYHVCPSSENFQFDTSFMYILGCLVGLRLFQSRHSDNSTQAHFAFMFLAVLILLAVIGVLFNGRPFWIVFAIFHVLVTFYVVRQIYYVDLFRTDRRLVQNLRLHRRNGCWRCAAPVHLGRFILLAIIFTLNSVAAVFGVIHQPKDSATFILGIIVGNMFIYFAVYIAMKCHKGEGASQKFGCLGVPLKSLIFCILSVIFWVPAIYLFVHNLTDWMSTPAQSRNLNKPCLLLDFYDSHDIWHFLSAGGLFCAFLAVLFMDDDRQGVRRSRIPVF